MGRVTKDAVLTVKEEYSHLRFVIAVNRSRKTSDKALVDFVPIVVWGAYAESLSMYIKKGKALLIEGILQVQEYDNKELERDWYTQICAEKIELLDGPKDSKTASSTDTVVKNTKSKQKELQRA